MKSFNFVKMVACGNDFIVIDNRKRIFPDKNKKFIQNLCAFHTGIGADGILLLENSNIADFKMRIFNPDGSEPDMCGNGARCISLYAWKQKLITKRFSVETLAGIIRAEITEKDKVRIYLNKPRGVKFTKKICTINTGVPHAIIYVPRIDNVNVNKLGKKIRWLKAYRPGGTNVDFVQILGKNRISVRTYERGVEGETLACGTGVTASAIISVLFHKLKSPVYAETKSGDTLIVDTQEVSLTGTAKIVFEGFVKF